MKWGIKCEKYLQGDRICRFYGDKMCPCVSDKETRKKYDVRKGPWYFGCPLPECESCTLFVPLDTEKIIEYSSFMTVMERAVYLRQSQNAAEVKRQEKRELNIRKKTPVRAKLLSAQGGTAAERVSKMVIGGLLFGEAGMLLGLLGSDKSNVKLIFNVEYADGHSEVVVEKANSKKAKMLLNLTKSEK